MIVRSPFPDITIPDATVTQYVQRRWHEYLHRPAFVDGGTGAVVTYGALRDRIARVAGGLVTDGFSPGDVVAILAPNSSAYAIAFHAAVVAGGTVTTLNPSYTVAEIRHQLQDARANLLVTSQGDLTFTGDRVIAAIATVDDLLAAQIQEPVVHQPIEGGIQRVCRQPDTTLRDRLDGLDYPVAMSGSRGQRGEDQERGSAHVRSMYRLSAYRRWSRSAYPQRSPVSPSTRTPGRRMGNDPRRSHCDCGLMRFGLFYELQLPRPWDEDDNYNLMREALEQIELADQLGFDYVWEVEHHFLEEYSHSSAPEVFLAAASQVTARIRLGHGIMLTAPNYNHPARVAEHVATLDLLSNGRVEFGSGESASNLELGGFGIDPAEKTAAWREGLEVALRCMTEDPFSGHDGTYVSMPPRNVVPKPRQRPHPPLWLACSRRTSIRRAASLGMGALSFAFIDPEEAATWVAEYESALDECVPIGKSVTTDIACVLPMMCHDDAATAVRRGLEGGNFFGYSLFHYAVGAHRPGTTNVWDEFQERRAESGFDPAVAAALQQEDLAAKLAAGQGLRGAVGTPQQLREFLRRYEAAGIDQMIFVVQAGLNQHEHICDALETFARDVMPEFKERDDGRRAAKAKRLEGAVVRALDRSAVDKPPMPDDYIVEGLARQKAGAAVSEQVLAATAGGKQSYIEAATTVRAKKRS